MLRYIHIILTITTLSSCQFLLPDNNQNGDKLTRFEIMIDNQKRTYHVYQPSEFNNKLPIVIMFHGSKGSGTEMSAQTGFNQIAEDQGYIVIYPDALVGNWAEDCDCNNADRLKVKDLEFVSSMIKKLKEDYSLKENKLFIVGYSQGGLFADRLACGMSNQLDGIIVVAASMSVPLSKKCMPDGTKSIAFIQGTQDRVLNYNGSNNGNLSLLSATETAKFWALKYGIISPPDTSYRPDKIRNSVRILTYRKNSDQTTHSLVKLYSLTGFGHGWPKTDNFNVNNEISDLLNEF